jgi:hypothetical protein
MSSSSGQDLRAALNQCKAQGYTRIADLKELVPYPIQGFERTATPYGDATLAVLDGVNGDDPMRIYMPRRYNTVMGDSEIAQYNAGVGARLSLMKKAALPGSKGPSLEFV